MARPMHQQPKLNNNWFTKQIQKFGPNFIEKMNSLDMKNGTGSLFRDLARNRVDIAKQGQYFLDAQFAEVCIAEAKLKFTYFSTNYHALNWYINTYGGNQISLNILEQNRRSAIAYDLIARHIEATYLSKDTNNLLVLVNTLRNFRSNI